MDRFVVRTARQEWQSQGVQQPSTSRGQQRTLYSLTKVVRLPPGTTPRVFSVDYLLSVKAVLDDSSSGKEALVDSIRQLSSLIMTESHLVESGVGPRPPRAEGRQNDVRWPRAVWTPPLSLLTPPAYLHPTLPSSP